MDRPELSIALESEMDPSSSSYVDGIPARDPGIPTDGGIITRIQATGFVPVRNARDHAWRGRLHGRSTNAS